MKLKFALNTLLSVLMLALLSTPVLAQGPSTTPPPFVLKIDAKYPKIEILPSGSAQFAVSLTYIDNTTDLSPKIFDLSVTGPSTWTTSITPDYPQDKKIASIQLDPFATGPQNILVNVSPPPYGLLNPGDYDFTLQANSGNLKNSVVLTVVVNPDYSLYLSSTNQLYSVNAGRDNYFPVTVTNYGSTAVGPITFNAIKPDGWTIEFTLPTIDSLGSNMEQQLSVNVRPPPGTPAGDYRITLESTSPETNAPDLSVTIRLNESSVGAWIAFAVIIIVIGGLAFLYLRRKAVR